MTTTPRPHPCGTRFRVTHPFVPQRGETFEVVDRRVSWGEVRLYFYDEDGCLQYMPEAWTDRSPVDPFVVLGGGEAWFRVVDLLRLTTLLAGLEGEE